MYHRLTQKRLGGVYFVSALAQTAWWIFFTSIYFHKVHLASVFEIWLNATIYGKVICLVLVAATFIYVRNLYDLAKIGVQLFGMDNLQYGRFRKVGREWRQKPFFAVMPIMMICLVMFTRFFGGEGIDVVKADITFGILTLLISIGCTVLCVLHFNQVKDYVREIMEIDDFT